MPKSKYRTTRSLVDSTPLAKTLLDQHAAQITQAIIRRALAGNIDAQRLCIERIIPACRERELPVRIPAGDSAIHIARAFQAVFTALSDGQLTVSEGQKLSSMLENQRKAIETGELEERIIDLETNTNTHPPCLPDFKDLPKELRNSEADPNQDEANQED